MHCGTRVENIFSGSLRARARGLSCVLMLNRRRRCSEPYFPENVGTSFWAVMHSEVCLCFLAFVNVKARVCV
ncbi:unnamed protein product [Ixodes persulcatus]